jgi:NTE family protein
MHRFSYYKDQKPFYETEISSEALSYEIFSKVKWGFPFLMTGKMEIGAGYGKINDQYSGLYTQKENKDRTIYKLGVFSARYDQSSFVQKQYPTTGRASSITAQYILGREYYDVYSLDSDRLRVVNSANNCSWMQFSAIYDRYFQLSKSFVLGAYVEGVHSTKQLEEHNYTETMLQTPAFTPTNHSKTVYNPAFRANTYAAGGLKPIFKINDQVHLRLESYLYFPLHPIYPNSRFTPVYGDMFTKIEYINELSAVVQFNLLAIRVYLNNYSFPAQNWNLGIDIGFLLFNDKLIEK